MDARIRAVTFNEEEHKYFFEGRELFGVTGAIGKLMGKHFPDTDTVKLAVLYGNTVHKEVENYYNGTGKLSTEGAKWIVQELSDFCNSFSDKSVTDIKCEVMVSDFEKTASKVDIVVRFDSNEAVLFDIKTTSAFDRPYCSLQLSVYKDLYEKCYGEKVIGMYVLGTKSKRRFRIIYQGAEKVLKILGMNKE